MDPGKNLLVLALRAAMFSGAPSSHAQSSTSQTVTPIAASAPTAVPALVPYSGTVIGETGKDLSTEIATSFLIYKDEQGGEPLWTETQTVNIDPGGHYKVQLGATSSNGLPSELFSTGEARWLEVQVAGQPPEPRVLLASVPYAMPVTRVLLAVCLLRLLPSPKPEPQRTLPPWRAKTSSPTQPRR